MTRNEYLDDATLTNPTVERGTALLHNNWLFDKLDPKKGGNPTMEEWFRPGGTTPEDVAYHFSLNGCPRMIRMVDGVVHVNIGVIFGMLGPKGKSNNAASAISAFLVLAAAIKAGLLNPDSEVTIPAALLEKLAAQEHEAWIKRDSYRKDAAYLALAVPYDQLDEVAKEQDRIRVKAMYAEILIDWAKLEK